LQKIYLSDWRTIPFPKWPVDCSVDNLLRQLLLLVLKSNELAQIPFIWFWPEGAQGCAMMTHDVETKEGRDFCPTLMDIDDHFGIKASFQVIPEQRYGVTASFLESIRSRNFEIAIHDLNHDGHLYRDRDEFRERALKINSYAKEYGAHGFRAAVLYRKLLWYDALDFAYDMSVPNVAHLDPQRGGCCTVMPYFLGRILELPVTASQDYTLFYILENFSIDLWKNQIGLIMSRHGLISFIVHPDYMLRARERTVYKQLLTYLARLRDKEHIWIATPAEVNTWWRQRAAMELVKSGGDWKIVGDGSERARVGFAHDLRGQLSYSFQPITASPGSRL
jgi:hypothetical protein